MMNARWLPMLVIGVLVLLPLPPQADGAVLLSNIDVALASAGYINTETSQAVIFDVPNGTNFQVNSFAMRAVCEYRFGICPMTLTAVLYKDVGESMWGTLITSTNFVVDTTSGRYDIPFTFTLEGGHRYSLVIASVTIGVTSWYTATEAPQGTLQYVASRYAYQGMEGLSSQPLFILIDGTTLDCAMLVEPVSTLLSPPHRAHLNTQFFQWSSVPNAESYRFFIYLPDRSFTFKQRGFTTQYTLPTPLAPYRYLWRVRVQDDTCHTWGAWSRRSTLFVD